MARREARPPARARNPTDPALHRVRELWRAALGGLPRPTHTHDIPGVGPPHPGGASMSQCRVCVVPCALPRRRRRSLGVAGVREFGLDIITVIGQLRYGEHRSIPEIHQRLVQQGVSIAQRTVTDLLERYEELVALHLADEERVKARLKQQGQVLLAIDGMQPDVGHEVLWIIRDCLSGEVLLARTLLSSTRGDLATLLGEVKEAMPVPIRGVISDGQQTIRQAVERCLPE